MRAKTLSFYLLPISYNYTATFKVILFKWKKLSDASVMTSSTAYGEQPNQRLLVKESISSDF